MMSRGQIIERKSGFTVRVFVGRDAKGKRIYKNQRVTGTKKDAQKVLTAILQKLDTGELLINPSLQTVEEYMTDWLENIAKPRIARGTFRNYTNHIKGKIIPALGRRKLSRLEPRSIQALYTSMSEAGLSPLTVAYTHNVLSSALKHAVGQRMIPSNPCEHVKLPKREHKEMSAMTENEAKRFREAAKRLDAERQASADNQNRKFHLYVPPFNYTFFSLLLDTGLRPSEALALKWKDLDVSNSVKSLRVVRALEFINGTAYFKEPKTKRSRRTVELLDETVTTLLSYRPDSAEQGDLIFQSMAGTPMNRHNVRNRHFKPCLLRAGLANEETSENGKPRFVSKFRMYDLRHTHATILLKANVNPKIVSERLGHASISLTLDTYSHVLPTMQRSAVEAIGNALYRNDSDEKEDGLALN